jgi:hypothetical protein
MSIFVDLYQSAQIGSAVATAERGEAKAENVQQAMRRLEDRVNQLTLINMALWSLLQETTGLTEEQLVARVHELDLRDGVINGRVRSKITQCPQCQQTLSQKHLRCLYCGFEPESQGAFDKVVR